MPVLGEHQTVSPSTLQGTITTGDRPYFCVVSCPIPLYHADSSRGGIGFYLHLSVYLFFGAISQKPMKLGPPNLTQRNVPR